mmetsp:Transcript_62745/g.168280  ORF Transcript_62745/g.168280 Transcript_62745/m.168280 type:complete len:287 (-) Transcript_62745:882-1742(-)
MPDVPKPRADLLVPSVRLHQGRNQVPWNPVHPLSSTIRPAQRTEPKPEGRQDRSDGADEQRLVERGFRDEGQTHGHPQHNVINNLPSGAGELHLRHPVRGPGCGRQQHEDTHRTLNGKNARPKQEGADEVEHAPPDHRPETGLRADGGDQEEQGGEAACDVMGQHQRVEMVNLRRFKEVGLTRGLNKRSNGEADHDQCGRGGPKELRVGVLLAEQVGRQLDDHAAGRGRQAHESPGEVPAVGQAGGEGDEVEDVDAAERSEERKPAVCLPVHLRISAGHQVPPHFT